tara:strand:+ start:314 stop:574 length:261 start_codon:yes stop_codon:yes gene_type:complete
MDIDNLSKNIKAKLLTNPSIENVVIEDKTYLHLKHASHDKNKFHIKLIVFSNDLKKRNKLDATKKVYKILEDEMKNYIHSIQILFE